MLTLTKKYDRGGPTAEDKNFLKEHVIIARPAHSFEKEEKLKYPTIPASVKPFMPISQQRVVKQNIKEFQDVLEHLEGIITKMPATYETEEIPQEEKVAYLHYFHGGSDWYIFEKDKGDPVNNDFEQNQMFGYSILGGDMQNAEFGYISMQEINQTAVELDFHFTPITFSELLKKHEEPGTPGGQKLTGEFVYGTHYGVPKYFGQRLIEELVDGHGFIIESEDKNAFVIRDPKTERHAKYMINDNGGEFNIMEMTGGKWHHKGDIPYNTTEGNITWEKLVEDINDLLRENDIEQQADIASGEEVVNYLDIVVLLDDDGQFQKDDYTQYFCVTVIKPVPELPEGGYYYTLKNNRTKEELLVRKNKFHVLTPDELKHFLSIKIIDAIKGDSIIESTSINELVNGKNQHEINELIRSLIKKNGKDRNKYSPQELQLLEYYEGSGGLAKEGEAGARLLDQFFTPNEIIKKMWGLAFKHGFTFKDANVLEPSVGSGRFLKFIPENEIDNVVTFEVDETAHIICELLYPKFAHHLESFESIFFDGKRHVGLAGVVHFFDLVIGNPPYREYVSKYAPLGEREATGASTFDQYFIMRGIDVLKPGGLLIFIIPSSFMNNKAKYNGFKEKLAEKADLVEAFRLPSGIFGNTDVTTDIIVLRKK